MPEFKDSIRFVSYTHLDVYKRQQMFFFIFYNSSPTCRGRRILAIYYIILNNQRLLTLSAAFDTQSQCVSEYIEFHSYLIQVFYAKLP